MKIVIIIFSLFFCSINVNGQEDRCISLCSRYYNLDPKMLDIWRLDTNGCKKERGFYAQSLEKNGLLIGMPKKLFLLFFGNPDLITEDVIYTYGVNSDCDKSKNKLPDSGFMNLLVLFNDDKVKSVIRQITE